MKLIYSSFLLNYFNGIIVLLLQVYLTTKLSRGCPTPSLPILHKGEGGMPTRIQQHGSRTAHHLHCSVHCWKEKSHPSPIHFQSPLLQVSCNSHTRPGLTDMGGVEEAGQTAASTNLEAAMFTFILP